MIPRENGLGPILSIQQHRDDRHLHLVGSENTIRAAPAIPQPPFQSPALSLPATDFT
jgi:hypothetical protein